MSEQHLEKRHKHHWGWFTVGPDTPIQSMEERCVDCWAERIEYRDETGRIRQRIEEAYP